MVLASGAVWRKGVRKEKTADEAYPGVIYYGDYVTQGLPFYAGNLVYETSVETEAGELWTEISRYRGALLQIEVDGKKKGNLIYAPYRMNLGKVRAGKHKICIRVFGNRANAFHPVLTQTGQKRGTVRICGGPVEINGHMNTGWRRWAFCRLRCTGW